MGGSKTEDRMRDKKHYKFTGKKHSKRGMLACALAAASIFAWIYLVLSSFWQGGNGSVYLGSIGILALLVALAAFVQAVKSMREEDSFRGFPVASILLSVLASGAWIALYAVGFWLG